MDFDPPTYNTPTGRTRSNLKFARYERIGDPGAGDFRSRIGRNGHVAFNEPGSPFESRTRVVRLASVTRADNARYFGGPGQTPSHAITQGIATIGQAAHLLVLASGSSKSEAVHATLKGPITSAVPASALRLFTRVTVLLDPLAAQMTDLRTA